MTDERPPCDAETRALYLSTIGHTYEEDHEGMWRCADCPGKARWYYTPESAEDACVKRWLTEWTIATGGHVR